jgi:hypothetical protein
MGNYWQRAFSLEDSGMKKERDFSTSRVRITRINREKWA